MNTNKSQFMVVVLLALLALTLVACSGPPSGAVSAAARKAEKSCEWNSGADCGDFKAVEHERREVSSADKANGITEKWCIRVEGVYQRGSRYHDWPAVSLVEKRNGTWEYKTTCVIGGL